MLPIHVLSSKIPAHIIEFLVQDFSERLVAKKFSVGQLAHEVGCSKSSISRRLRPLAEVGLVISSPEKNRRTTRLNPTHPLIVKLLELKVLHGQDWTRFEIEQKAARELQKLRAALEAEQRRTRGLLQQLNYVQQLRTRSVSEFSAHLVQTMVEVLKEQIFRSEDELRERLVRLIVEELRAEFPLLWRE